MADEPLILIATSSFEEHSYVPVCRRLADGGASFVVFLTDKVLDGSERFRLEISELGAVDVAYKGRTIAPNALGAGWYWKVASFRVGDADQNVSKQMTMVNEVTGMHNAIWSVYPDSLWLSSPANLWRAERKLDQLLLAQRVGFTIPRTLVGNDWSDIADPLLADEPSFIVKMARGVLADQNVVKAMQTTRLDAPTLDGLRESTVPFPGFYQPFVPKAREWRVTVVGDELFAVAIYTDEGAKDDWRRHQMTAAVRFELDTLPAPVTDRCLAFLRSMELGYGAFDLIEKPDGEVVFLECNPSGQFSWLEEQLDLPISDAIATQLIRKCKHLI